jgi:hypothetical protein
MILKIDKNKIMSAFIVFLLAYSCCAWSNILPDTCAPSTWSVNKPVYALCPSGNIMYLGGMFTKIGRDTGNWAIFNSRTGGTERFFEFRGEEAFSVYSDQKGGWFIADHQIWHLFPSGQKDTAWNPCIDSRRINALIVKGSTLFAGGEALKNYKTNKMYGGFVAIDLETGAIDSVRSARVNGVLYSLSANGSVLYAGGAFDSVGGEKKYNLVAFDVATGKILPWNPNPNPTGYVYSVFAQAKVVYAGGAFVTVGGQGGPFFAALDSSTGSALPLNANPDRTVKAIAAVGNRVFVGGDFKAIGGQARSNIACLDASTGAALSWAPGADGAVTSLLLKGNSLFAVGKFKTVGGRARNNLAALDVESGSALAWDPCVDSTVNAIALDDSSVFAVGGFQFIGVNYRNGLAAIDVRNGRATSWAPKINGTIGIRAIAVKGTIVYAGGSFDTANGQIRKGIAAFDAATGAVTSWNPALARIGDYPPAVLSIAISGDKIYMGGYFDSASGLPRLNLVSADASSGAVSAWNPGLDSGSSNVEALAIENNRLYVGGYFDTIQHLVRHGIAAFDIQSGNLDSWSPALAKGGSLGYGRSGVLIKSIVPYGNTVFVGGTFDSADGTYIKNVACLDSASGKALSWSRWTSESDEVYIGALALKDTVLYAGGYSHYLNSFSTSIGRLPMWGGVRFEMFDGPSVNALAFCGNALYVGGGFNQIDVSHGNYWTYQTRMFFARYGEYSSLVQTRRINRAVASLENVLLRGSKIYYNLSRPEHVRLSVYSVNGRRTTLENGMLPAGWYSSDLADRRLPNGLYIVRFEAGSAKATRSFTVVK